MNRKRARTALVLGTILLGCFLTVIVWNVWAARTAPVEEPGTISVVLCPECKEAFYGLLRGGGTIQCALYDVGEETAAVLRSVNVDVITDDKTRAAYGEPVPGSALMHHKFCVINGSVVTSGSYNPTDGGEKSRNNLVIIESRTLAANYLHQFAAVRDRRREGAREPLVYLMDEQAESVTRIENYFCPADGCEEKVVRALAQAQEEVLFLTFSFTSDAIGDTLEELQARGVRVSGVCDSRQFSSERAYSECERLGASFWSNAGGRGLLHHKVFIIDGVTVVTGSYNPTASGTRRNNENVLIVTDASFATPFLEEYAAVQAVLAAMP